MDENNMTPIQRRINQVNMPQPRPGLMSQAMGGLSTANTILSLKNNMSQPDPKQPGQGG